MRREWHPVIECGIVCVIALFIAAFVITVAITGAIVFVCLDTGSTQCYGFLKNESSRF